VIGTDPFIDAQERPADGDPDASALPAGAPVSGHPVDARRVVQATVLGVPVAVLAVLAWTHRSMYFDGYIYLHVVQNVLAGNGPVFNAGQRVEAVTSPLWTGALSFAGLVTPFPLTGIAVDLGILCTVSGFGLVVVASTRLVRRAAPDRILVPLGSLVFVAVSPVWSLASLGLETGMVFAWLAGCLAVLVRWAGPEGRDVPRWSLVVLGLGPLVRPELALDTVVFLAVVVFVDGGAVRRRRRAAMVTWAFALPLAYEVFRMGYYGMVVATTAVAKEAWLPSPGQGVAYLTDFLTPYWLVVPAAALLVGAYGPLSALLRDRPDATRNRAALVALPIAAACNAGYITVMGGDYVHGRLLMAPFFAACAPVAVVPLARRFAVSLVVIPWALVCAVSLRSSDHTSTSTGAVIAVDGHGSVAAVAPGANDWGSAAAAATWLAPGGTYLQEDPAVAPVRLSAPGPPGRVTPTIATYWVGQGPYELGTGVRILDLLGLADPLDAHMQLHRRGVFPGHEKPLPTPWIAALLTAPGASPAQMAALQRDRPSVYTPLVPEASGVALDVQVAWARAALGCPTLHALEFGPDRPLTVGSFVDSVVRAPSASTLRVPPDPETAYHRFCGPGTPAGVRALRA
jgi:arabinofuranosyltransferase